MKWFVWVYRHIYLQPDIEVVGEAENGRKGSELALQLKVGYYFNGPCYG